MQLIKHLFKILSFRKKNKNGNTKEEFKSVISNDFIKFKNHIKKCQKQINDHKPYDKYADD